MALLNSTTPELGSDRETLLLRRLLGLYEEEIQIYQQVLELSREQGFLIKQGRNIADIRRLLEKKKNCLVIIGRLEATEKTAKREWDQGRPSWSARGRAQLHEVLSRVGDLIEKILLTEEDNDLQLIAKTRAV